MRKVISKVALMLILLIVIIVVNSMTSSNQWISIFWDLNFAYLFFKLISSLKPQEYSLQSVEGSVTLIVPNYNESLKSIKTFMEALEKQTIQPSEIIFVDDGSHQLDGYCYMQQLAVKDARIRCHRFDNNQGKKAALAYGIQKATSDFLLFMDSDGEIEDKAIEYLMSPFADESVGSVCGRVSVRNRNATFLTRIQEIVYFNTFHVGRKSQSIYGSVIVCSGAFSMFRAHLMNEETLRLLAKKSFFGIPCVAGDDRLMTDAVLSQNYRSVYQPLACCYTDVPESFNQYRRQQTRWLKSAYLMSIYSLRYSFKKPITLLFQILDAHLWLLNLVTVLVALYLGNINLSLIILVCFIIHQLLVAYLSSIHLSSHRLRDYFTSSLYLLVYGFFLIGFRLIALVTLKKTGWNTR